VDGAVVDRRVEVTSIARALDARTGWQAVEQVFVDEARAIVSNTGDRGYELDPADRADTPVPSSFPAKLAKLLHARWRHRREPLDLFACELVSGNGTVLRDTVQGVARQWGLDGGFSDWLASRCRWPNALVDRIVSEPLDPIGAIAEPYALWAIEALPGVEPICRHPAIVVTDDLLRYERLKLLILNLGHTFLAEIWLRDRRPVDETVKEILDDPAVGPALDALYDEEVLPVFAAIGLGDAAIAYRRTAMERLRNPFLRHRMADIATNHRAKKERRFAYLIALAKQHAPAHALPRLEAALASPLG
jgi:tagaturonate reductase